MFDERYNPQELDDAEQVEYLRRWRLAHPNYKRGIDWKTLALGLATLAVYLWWLG